MEDSSSLFERFITRKRRVWVTLVVSLLLLALPFGAAYLDNALEEIYRQGEWRVLLLAPAIIIYILLVSPVMTRMEENVLQTLRPLLLLDDEEYDRLVSQSSDTNPLHEWLAFGIGFSLGIAASMASGIDEQYTWLLIYWFASMGLMYGLLAWTIFVAAAGTRMNAALHRSPLRIDILDSTPFEVVGRQSLLMALVFLGGITLSLLLSFQPENISTPEFWIIYVLLVLVTMLIFFLNMRPTHLVLAAEKKRELEPVQHHIRRSSRALVECLDQGQDTEKLAAEINALVIYEERLQSAFTWPYNTSMLRTLFFSVFVPIGTLLARVGFELLFQ